MAIDGEIYVLKNTGEVKKFLKGSQQDFQLDIIDPKFEEVDKIIISPNLDYIYILEKKNKRLAIFSKKGAFIMQYKLETMHNLKDFTVDEKNQEIYFLA